jgi:hypothetical protein
MRRIFTAAATLVVLVALMAPSLMAGTGSDGNRFNFFQSVYQWLRDDDGDGIPNCLDPDYVRPEDGTGYGKLGPSLSAVPSGDQDRQRDQTRDQLKLRDRDQLKDGSCQSTGIMYRYQTQYRLSKGTK